MGQGTVQPDPQNLQRILDIPMPISKRNVRSLMGLINYYGRFIPNMPHYNKVSSALIKKKKAPTKINWNTNLQYLGNKPSTYS